LKWYPVSPFIDVNLSRLMKEEEEEEEEEEDKK
jgi:hypothetical protein